MERKKQLWALIGLTALTMAPQYAMQGWLATGGNLAGLGDWFPRVDSAAWALRAIIEAWALLYLFSTPARDERQARTLAGFEIALIVLIVITLGPALATAGSNETMREYLKGHWYSAWNFAVATYAPLMLGAAGFAFKVESQGASKAAGSADDNPIIEPIAEPKLTLPKQPAIARKPSRSKTSDKTLDRARQILASDPTISGGELGRKLGKSESRGRQLRAEIMPTVEGPANGNGAHQ